MQEQNSLAVVPALEPFFSKKAAFKTACGGRSSGKTKGISLILLYMAMHQPLRIFCAREFQTSLRDSSYQVLVDWINDKEWLEFWAVYQDRIIGLNGSEFRFGGLKNNIDKLRSFEGIDIVWVEEAANVSKHSWDILEPTIRKTGSEIWISFNPNLEQDYTYQRFVKNQYQSDDPEKDEIVVHLNYYDNPFLPSKSKAQVEKAKELAEEALEHGDASIMNDYRHIWLGEPRSAYEGAIYAKEMAELDRSDRLTKVPYTPGGIPVDTFWDLGYKDSCCIIMAQKVNGFYHIIDYYENSLEPIDHYILELQKKNYIWGIDYLPHDGRRKNLVSELTIEKIMKNAGRKPFVLAADSILIGVNAARTIFPLCRFDKEKTIDLIQALRKYRWADNQEKPMHDNWSHPSDAFRYLAMAMKNPKRKEQPAVHDPYSHGPKADAWAWS